MQDEDVWRAVDTMTRLVEPIDAYADAASIREAMKRCRAPFCLRRAKEAMVNFPERRADGNWAAKPIFSKRIPHAVGFATDGPECDLYDKVTRFVKRQSARAAAAKGRRHADRRENASLEGGQRCRI